MSAYVTSEISLHCLRRQHAPGTRLSTTYYSTANKHHIKHHRSL